MKKIHVLSRTTSRDT